MPSKDEILDAISALFGDDSVPNTQTLEDLEEIQADVESKIECLRADIG